MDLTSPQRRLIIETDFENRRKSRDFQSGDLESTARWYRDLLRRGEISPEKLWCIRIITKDVPTRRATQEVLGQEHPTVDVMVRIFQALDNSGLANTKDLFAYFRRVARHWWRHKGYEGAWPNPHVSDENDFMVLARNIRQAPDGENSFIRAASKALREWAYKHPHEINTWLDL